MKNMFGHNRIFVMFKLCAWVILLTACAATLSQKIKDGGVISAEPCSAPCFWGVTPGVTAKDEVIVILNQQNAIADCNVNNFDITCEHKILIEFNSDYVVDTVSFTPTRKITVQDVTKRYGLPNAVAILDLTLLSESPETRMIIFFDGIKAVFILSSQKSLSYSLKPSAKISDVVYLDAYAYDQFVASTKDKVNWSGYGTYDIESTENQ